MKYHRIMFRVDCTLEIQLPHNRKITVIKVRKDDTMQVCIQPYVSSSRIEMCHLTTLDGGRMLDVPFSKFQLL